MYTTHSTHFCWKSFELRPGILGLFFPPQIVIIHSCLCSHNFCIQERNIKFAALPTEDDEKEDKESLSKDKLYEARIMAALATSHVSGATVELDEEGSLNWPVRFLYPEYSQSDMIEAFNENSRLVFVSRELGTMGRGTIGMRAMGRGLCSC